MANSICWTISKRTALSTGLAASALLCLPTSANASLRASSTEPAYKTIAVSEAQPLIPEARPEAQLNEPNHNQLTSLKRGYEKQRRRPRPPQRPRAPRRFPPNRVRPGGGLDSIAQSCAPTNPPLTALVPEENPVYTTAAHPTFLFHLPDSPESIRYIEFIVLSADEKEQIYAAQLTPTESGIVAISMPSSSSRSLEIDQTYHWYLNVHCQNIADVPSVNGWVQRLSPLAVNARTNTLAEMPTDELTNEPTEAPVGEAASQPSEALPTRTRPLIWYDAIAQVAAERAAENSSQVTTQAATQTATQTATQANRQWQTWLTAIGLGDIVDIPLVEAPSPR